MNYTGLLWAMLFDFLIWSYKPGMPVYAGGLIVVTSNLFILYRENRVRLRLLEHKTAA